ncbi:mycothiol system anti-sigma-R factor [Actinopolymorpha cephalotaxi]|uniref:Mycothiol system anti-sigma-R factor n=1 Tax=Actinopolymorpha cephalotaxi TaxID=504797 RepID=A0A1I2Z4T5_9ACTN|nr:mycothiol system anti-sigma-R factor [Actinopolymorpha cephalotaxi]NYH81856.1 mycothiol system anti-sigma-R factor [Actinopolymorpha cephalotaxi]SFH32730.1 mycothiol system anti-sigma-R factor [Actinopolymorpha cephalotaxi]
MSCGKPHETDCSEVLERVFLFLDREMEAADCSQIQRHLDECAPCLQKYDLEGLVKSLVARSCGQDRPPSDLRQKVLLRIRAVHVEISEDSGPQAG